MQNLQLGSPKPHRPHIMQPPPPSEPISSIESKPTHRSDDSHKGPESTARKQSSRRGAPGPVHARNMQAWRGSRSRRGTHGGGARKEEHGDGKERRRPEVSVSSYKACMSLGDQIEDLKRLTDLYADFDEVCKDAPAYLYLSHIHLSHINYTLRFVHHGLRDVALLREEGEGTADATVLERVASGTLAVHRDAIKDWRHRVEEIVGKGKEKAHKLDAAAREKLDPQQRQWALEFYVGKMRVTLADAEGGAVEEIKEMREALKQVFEEKAKMTQKDVENMLLDEAGW